MGDAAKSNRPWGRQAPVLHDTAEFLDSYISNASNKLQRTAKSRGQPRDDVRAFGACCRLRVEVSGSARGNGEMGC